MMAVRAGMVALLMPLTLLGTGAVAPQPQSPQPPQHGHDPVGPHGHDVRPHQGIDLARPRLLGPVRPFSLEQEPVLALGRFGPYRPGRQATTYDPNLIPTGAAVAVAYVPGRNGRSTVQIGVQGLLPNRPYGAHVHTKRCGPKGDDAGPHYQHVKDPVTPSTNPKYANPRNEVWLDFTTDANGNASARSRLDWSFTDPRPRSVVIHTEHTHTGPGHAGQAGARLACVNVDF